MKLLELALKAHGGLARWNTFNRVSATIVGAGGLWPMKNAALDPGPREIGVVSFRSRRCAAIPLGLNNQSNHVPRVVASLQPWVLLRSPFVANRGTTRSVSTPTSS